MTLQTTKRTKTKNCKHSGSNVNMPNFRETREALLHAHLDNATDDEEFVLLFNLNTSKNLDIEYWKYHTFDLNSYDDDVVAEFRFMKRDIHRLRDDLDLPNEITCHFYNDLAVDSTEASCIVLSRLAYPYFLCLVDQYSSY